MLPFLIKTPIKILQRQHEQLLNEAFTFFNQNKRLAYPKIVQAEKIATRIQQLKKYATNP